MLEASFCQAAAVGLPAGREKATSVDWALVGGGRLAETVRLGWFGTSNVVETRLVSKTFHPFLGCVAERAG